MISTIGQERFRNLLHSIGKDSSLEHLFSETGQEDFEKFSIKSRFSSTSQVATTTG